MAKSRGEWKTALGSLARGLSRRHKRSERVRRAGSWILAIVPEGANRLALQSISEQAGWTLAFSDSGTDRGCLTLPVIPPIVIYDRGLSQEHWGEIIRALAKKSPRPYIILLSSSTDANLWDELERVGGSDILRTPINRDHLLRALRRAWQICYTQQQVRPLTR
jgi:FixJ family two-component response regulator